jgi:hypothetical protein
LVINFNQTAPYPIRNRSVALSLHQDSNGALIWQCGRLQFRVGLRISQRDSAELTTIDSRYLPISCR